jgi:hypothetical protein
MSEFNSDVIDEERKVYARPIVIRNNHKKFFLAQMGTIFSFSPFFAKREKSEGYGVDALDGGMRGGGFGYKKAANRRGLMKRSDQLKRRTDRRQAAWVSR